MKTIQLLLASAASTHEALAEPLYVDKDSRALLFTVKPWQSIKEHNTPDSPTYAVILKGRGVFAGADGKELQLGPHGLLIFEAGEDHNIRALDQQLVFVEFLHGAPGNVSDRVGGEIGRRENTLKLTEAPTVASPPNETRLQGENS